MLAKCECGQDMCITGGICDNCREEINKLPPLPSVTPEHIDYYLFLDCETTGDPDQKILEVGWMLTNVKLEPLHECRSEVIHHDYYFMNDFILKMHTRNGLLAEVAKSVTTLSDVEDTICESIQVLQERESTSRIILAGFSPHNDRWWIKRDAPKLDSLLHFRHFDVSVPRGMYNNWVEKIPNRKDEHPHRAKDDVFASWKIAKSYKTLFENVIPRLKDIGGMEI
jgi:oligoribonuclease (3'-5' exoribonuclease)